MRRIAIMLTLTIFGTACSNPKPSEQSILEGLLDFPILGDRTFSTDCYVSEIMEKQSSRIECLIAPISNSFRENGGADAGTSTNKDYAKMMTDSGWTPSFIKKPLYGFQKPVDTNCSKEVFILEWFDAELKVARKAINTGNLDNIKNSSLVFLEKRDLVCGDKRVKTK